MTSPALVSMRGGACFRSSCRSAYRGRSQSADTYYGFGFRVVCLPQEVAPVVRGGCWDGGLLGCRSAIRDDAGPGYDDDLMGFRVVCLQAAPQDLTWLA